MRDIDALIEDYLMLESRRFSILANPTAKLLESYEQYEVVQTILQKKIEAVSGEEGLLTLEQSLKNKQAELEASHWAKLPPECILHELRINPKFVVPAESCTISPQNNIDAAIIAFTDIDHPDWNPMLDVLEGLANKIALYIPNDENRLKKLAQWKRSFMMDNLKSNGADGFFQIMNSLLEEIKTVESHQHRSETVAFQEDLYHRFKSEEDGFGLLKKAHHFCFKKLSEINFEIRNFYINRYAMQDIDDIEFEKLQFNERLGKNEFTLSGVIDVIDSIVENPNQYRLESRLLCSQYIGTYLTHAILLDILQRPGNFTLTNIPETFYLDLGRLIEWRRKYQQLFYTALGLNLYHHLSGPTLSPEDLLDLKQTFMTSLETHNMMSCEEASRIIFTTLKAALASSGVHSKFNRPLLKSATEREVQGATDRRTGVDARVNEDSSTESTKQFTSVVAFEKRFSAIEEQGLIELVKKIVSGHHPVAKAIHKSIGDQLWGFLFRGYLLEDKNASTKKVAFNEEILKLGHEITPLLGLHIEVHNELYKSIIEERLWGNLRLGLNNHDAPLLLFASQAKLIDKARASLEKMAFLLGALTLIQQKFTVDEMWNLEDTLSNAEIKKSMASSHLIEMVKNPLISKDEIASKLIEVLKEEYDISEPEALLDIGEKNNPPHFKHFFDTLLDGCWEFAKSGEIPDLRENSLLAEFRKDLGPIFIQVQKLINAAKQNQMPVDENPVTFKPIIPKLQSGLRVNGI